MAKEQAEGKLKLIHLVYGLLAAAVLIGISIGAMGNQQKTNTDNIEKVELKKVEKEVFEQHQQTQQRTFEKIDKGIEKLDKKLDDIAKKL